MPRRRHESIGEVISTAVFFGVSITLFIAAFDSFEIQNRLKGLGFFAAGLMCFLGGLRYPIARFSDNIRRLWRNKND